MNLPSKYLKCKQPSCIVGAVSLLFVLSHLQKGSTCQFYYVCNLKFLDTFDSVTKFPCINKLR